MSDRRQRVGLETARREPLDHAGLRVRRHRAHLAPGIGEEAERARSGDRRVELAQRAGRGVARVDIELLTGLRLLAVKFEERSLGHVDFAAHLAHRRHAAALEPLRDVLQRPDIGGDVLALAAVAARRGGDELAAFVAQRHRQAVDLRLGAEDDLVVLAEAQEAPDAADEVDDILVGEGVVEREHRHRVADLGKARRRRRADALRQAVERTQLREPRLDRGVALPQPVVLGVGDGRRVFLIVAAVVRGDLFGKPRVLGLRLLFGEGLDRKLRGILGCHDVRCSGTTEGRNESM